MLSLFFAVFIPFSVKAVVNQASLNQKIVQIEGQDTVLHLADLRPIFKTEAGFQEECLNCKKNSSHSHIKNIKKIWNVRTCGIVSDSQELITMEEEKATLSDFWAQEMIGADLLREEIKKNSPLKRKSFIAVLDSEKPIFENEKENPDYKPHAPFVKNLISHEGPQAVLPELNQEQLLFVQADKSSDYVFEDSNEQKILAAASPSFINISMEWAKHNEVVYKKFKSLSPPSVVVTSTGNKFPSPIERQKRKASKDFDAVLVGSLSPSGFVSEFSQSSEEVHILAPSDEYITSFYEGDLATFRGTSGATALVTGSLAGFEWLSDYHPTAAEVKRLLEKTAIPTVHSHGNPRKKRHRSSEQL